MAKNALAVSHPVVHFDGSIPEPIERRMSRQSQRSYGLDFNSKDGGKK